MMNSVSAASGICRTVWRADQYLSHVGQRTEVHEVVQADPQCQSLRLLDRVRRGKALRRAQAAIDEGRRIGAKTERDYIEVVA